MYFMGDGHLRVCFTVNKIKIAPPRGGYLLFSDAFLHLKWVEAVKSRAPASRHQTCPIWKPGWYKRL